jgi:hypothetical protein
MSDILLRVELHNPQQAHAALTGQAWPWIKAQTFAGRALVAEFRPLDDAITEEQRAYYHGVVLSEIAAFARPNGQQFPLAVWKEHFRREFLPDKVRTFTNPITGRKSRRRVRVSTEDLGVRGYAELIDKVIAFAATELGVTVSEPLPGHLRGTRAKAKRETVDAETGEIMQEAA